MAKRKLPKLLRPVAVAADIHLGNFRQFGGVMQAGLNVRGRLTAETLGAAMRRAERLDCEHFIVAGDLFHNRRPEPAIIAIAQQVIGDHMKTHLIPGNHDELEATSVYGNTACAPLRTVADVVDGWKDLVLSDDHVMRLVPFQALKPMAEFLDEVCTNFKATSQKVRALVTHVGVVDGDSPPWLRQAADAIESERLFKIMEREGIHLSVVGNYHQHREWRRDGMTIVQAGALNPTGFADAGLDYGGLVIWDGADVRWEQVPGPRFLTERPTVDLPGCTVFLRLEEAGTASGEVNLEVIPKQPEKLLAGPQASDVSSALAAWAERQAGSYGLEPGKLLDTLRSYWKAAS